MLEDMRGKHIALVNKYFGEVEARVRNAILVDYKDALVQAMKDRLKEKGKELTTEQYDQIMSRVLAKLDQAMKATVSRGRRCGIFWPIRLHSSGGRLRPGLGEKPPRS